MRTVILSFTVLLALFVFTPANAKAQAKNGKDIFGYFSIAGTVPKEFRDIDTIHLAGDYGAKEKPPFYGMIRLKTRRAADYPLLKPTGTGKNISFTTKAVRGVSYQFTGAFTRLDVENVDVASNAVVLKGKLTKLKNGKEIAQSNVGFTYFPGT